MAKMNCFTALIWKKKKLQKGSMEPCNVKDSHENDVVEFYGTLKDCKEGDSNKGSDGEAVHDIGRNPACQASIFSLGQVLVPESAEMAYEAGDEHDSDDTSMKRELSDADLQVHAEDNLVITMKCAQSQISTSVENSNFFDGENGRKGMNPDAHVGGLGERVMIGMDRSGHASDPGERDLFGMYRSGHVSDPGLTKTASDVPVLERSCSCVNASEVLKKFEDHLLSPNPHSFEDLQILAREKIVQDAKSGPLSPLSSCSADKVMLKKHSSSQVLPSRNRRLWWKLFLCSHRNLHRPAISTLGHRSTGAILPQRDGYSSDILESSLGAALEGSTRTMEGIEKPNLFCNESGARAWSSFEKSSSDCWPMSQWVAFASEASTYSKVDEWINTLEFEPVLLLDDKMCDENDDEAKPVSLDKKQNPANWVYPGMTEDVLQANNVIKSLTSLSSVAHITGMGLKIIPNISLFCSLRAVDLSSNCIVRINLGSLPKSLHILNLSKNRITVIEGLRELTRLRVLDLSYNRITRIGHGLSNCTLIKELYLAGNKIGEVEGLHRLLKLTVLDLSFNKITIAKSLGQLVANYSHLLALNLLGSPIQTNMGDDQLRKTVLSLLPQLAYLNKQPIKPQRVREAVIDSVAKAALRNNNRDGRRKPTRRFSQIPISAKGHGENRHRRQKKPMGRH